MSFSVRRHYDALIDENNDPFRDPPALAAYMDKWDGEAFLKRLLLDRNPAALEIGVGTGRLAGRVAPFCRSFCGIDISPKTIERAKENLAEYAGVKLVCGNFLTYAFNETYDVIYSSLTFMHIRQKRRAFEKIGTLLRPGGRFVLSIDKNPQSRLICAQRTVRLYPDKPHDIQAYACEAGLTLWERASTEFANLFVFV